MPQDDRGGNGVGTVSFRHASGQSDSQDEDEAIRMLMKPHVVQSLLWQTARPRRSLCGIVLPVAFDRAAEGTFLDPRFDSEILEGQYRASTFPQIRIRFRSVDKKF
ncbi:uncharacterized protein LOC113373396 [Ctenocephalides felis]|uniref:uncharacterized protein LOC113373396 n=1 Tax=Ctenocephalides felis TaxID=7515 RepID=UPI000E6E513A|nr:uncharacterized protein LOC113373396 [Ctenocephalides felis]